MWHSSSHRLRVKRLSVPAIRFVPPIAFLLFPMIVVEEGGPRLLAREAESPKAEARESEAENADSEAPPEKTALSERIEKWIDRLGDDDYYVRQSAQEALAEIGIPAFSAIRRATESDDFEVAHRARYLMRLMEQRWVTPSDPPEVRRLMRDYPLSTIPERHETIRDLVDLPAGKGMEALCRIVSFAEYPELRYDAASSIITLAPTSPTPREQWFSTAEEQLQPTAEDPYSRLILEYIALEETEKRDTDAFRDQLDAYAKLAARLIEKSRDKRIRETDILMYYFLAEFLRDAGRKEKAEKVITEARYLGYDLYPERENPNPRRLDPNEMLRRRLAYEHFQAGFILSSRQQLRLALEEFKGVQEKGTPEMGLLASSRIAEIHYEMGDPATAAESLQQAIDKIKGTKKLDTGYIGLSTQDFISRRNFFQALIALEEKNYEKAKELVDEGLQNDPHAIDCLILRYRMPEVSEEYRERTRKLLKEVAQHLRGEIEKRPDSSTPYNQLAWLLGNTGGTGSTGDEEDFEEALKMANKALELSPENPSLLDTLAHVHFGAGQYEKAVQVQEKAVRLAPRSTLLSEELQRFRDKLREVSQE